MAKRKRKATKPNKGAAEIPAAPLFVSGAADKAGKDDGAAMDAVLSADEVRIASVINRVIALTPDTVRALFYAVPDEVRVEQADLDKLATIEPGAAANPSIADIARELNGLTGDERIKADAIAPPATPPAALTGRQIADLIDELPDEQKPAGTAAPIRDTAAAIEQVGADGAAINGAQYQATDSDLIWFGQVDGALRGPYRPERNGQATTASFEQLSIDPTLGPRLNVYRTDGAPLTFALTSAGRYRLTIPAGVRVDWLDFDADGDADGKLQTVSGGFTVEVDNSANGFPRSLSPKIYNKGNDSPQLRGGVVERNTTTGNLTAVTFENAAGQFPSGLIVRIR